MVIILLFSSCSKSFLENTNENVTNMNSFEPQNIPIGEKLKNPYSVANMKEALKVVKGSNKDFIISEKDIKPTHLINSF